jgi:hypothetical protein
VNDLTTGVQQGSVGSVILLRMGKDVTLQPGKYPGQVGQFNCNIKFSITNNSAVTINNPTMSVITSTPQTLTTNPGGHADMLYGIPEQTQSGHYAPYYQVMKHYTGGSFSSFMNKVMGFIRPINDFLKTSKIISNLTSKIPHPIAQAFSQVANQLGYGEGEGGKILPKKDLKRRIRAVRRLR